MSLNDIRSFEGQPWLAFAKYIDKESGPQKKGSAISESEHSNSISLSSEDIALYGKYPGSEPFILALCGYCGDKFKVPVLAKHIALTHSGNKATEIQKVEVKSPNSILKKNKVKLKKESPESTTSTTPVKSSKQPSKVLIQVDRRRINCTSSNDGLSVSKHHIESQDDKLNLETSKNEKSVTQETELSKVKKLKDDRNYSSYKQNSASKSIANGNIDHNVNAFLPRAKEKVDSKKAKNTLSEATKFEFEKFKVYDSNISKERVVAVDNGITEDILDDSNIDLKRCKVIPKTNLYNPDLHCGVIGKENSKPCTRPLTCKSHRISLRRAVRGRSKNFDQLLADHRSEKESSKHSSNETPTDTNISPEIIKNLQLTPIKIPLVLNPHLSEPELVQDVINPDLPPNKNVNGVRLNCEINSDVIHNINNLNHFPSTNNNTRKKAKKVKKKRKLNNVKKPHVKCFSQWHPWYRRIGGMLYTQNNLPTFATLKNVRKKVKSPFTDKKETARYNVKVLRNFNNTNCLRRHVKSNEYDHKDWPTDFRLQHTRLRNATSTQAYGLEDVKEVYFKLIPENKQSSVLRIRNESLAITFPPSSLSLLANSLSSDNQFLVQKKRDYPYIHKYIYSYNNSEDSSSESDTEDMMTSEDVTDIRYTIMEPVRTNKEVSYSNHITLAPLSGHPLRNHRFHSRADERNFNLGIGTLNDGQVCLETIKRLHFVTPSGPTAVALKQHPVVPEGSYNLAKSLVEE